jgi:hypothetical protein
MDFQIQKKYPSFSDPRRVHLAESAFFSPFTGIKTRSVVESAATAIPHAACNSQFAYLVKQTKRNPLRNHSGWRVKSIICLAVCA